MSYSHYSLLEDAIKLGGSLRRTVDLETGEVLQAVEPESGFSEGESTPKNRAGEAAPLSSPHKRPFLTYRAGARFLKSSRAIPSEQVGGGKRGGIAGFSAASRRRLMVVINSIRQDAPLPAFITLTYPESFPDPKSSKRHLDIFVRRFRRAFPGAGLIWKLEPQERGAPHYHMLAWGCDFRKLRDMVPGAWYDIAGGNDYKHYLWHTGQCGNGNVHCVQKVRSFKGVLAYASKYLGKTFDVSGWSEKWTGRYWAVVNKSGIPFGEEVTIEVTSSKAVEIIRYGRRFAGLPGRDYKSLSIFCDADQWVDRLEVQGVV